MKRLLPLLIFLLICSFAQTSSARMNAYIAGSVASAAACSNNTSTDFIGQKATAIADDAQMGENVMVCYAVQATSMTCDTGHFKYAYMNHHGTSEANIKVAVYVNSHGSDTVPADATNNTKVGVSGAITTSTDSESATFTDSSNLGGTATKNGWYYVCIIGDATEWRYHYDSGTGSQYSKGVTGSYATPPDTLSASGWSTTTTRRANVYVQIGD